MKLELKHLSPYLPYGLRLQFIIRDEVVRTGLMTRILNYSHENHPERIAIDNYDSEHVWMFKPILRPLSDFDNPNKYNSDFYSFMSELNSGLPYDYQIDKDLDFTVENPRYVACKYALEVYDFLFKNHFDVFGLIDAGLAIDINTVPELLNG